MLWSAAGAVRRNPSLAAVLIVGLVARAVLIPITHGEDFIVWDLATKATLRGQDVYAHHPAYPGGPFAYFPLFLYVELPFQWLAEHTALSFVVLGKLPVLAADVACTGLLAREFRSRGAGERVVATGCAAFFLNPLVLYNSAWYGRFDTLGCALLLAALRTWRADRGASWRSSVWYGLAVAAKTFPIFILAGLLRAAGERWRRVLVALVLVLLVVSSPYLPSAYHLGHDIVFYDVGKTPTGLSWQHLITGLFGTEPARVASYLLLAGFVVLAVRLTRYGDLTRYTALVLVLFLLCSKVVLEQYLIWPLPWLLLLASTGRSLFGRAAAALAGVFTVVGAVDNESFHPLGRSSPVLIVIVTLAALGFLAAGVRDGRATPQPAGKVRA